MSKIVRGGQTGSLDNINSSQGVFRTQIAALTDAVRQLGGNAEIGAGAVVNDPLSAPYVLYVNPYTGKDTFVGGNYSTSGDATKRIELQRLECGYTEARPFKTISRAIIEAGIITAKSFYTSPLTNNDLVSIILAPGAQTVLNGAGAGSVSEWAATKEPTDAELQAFNPSTTGGILLPRGVSLCGIDLRKTIIRPDAVPAVADETSNVSNRRSIFKVTGTGYYFGFTFMDKVGSTASHHLLHCFEFASQSELDEFYTKIRQAFGGANNTGGLDNALAVTRSSEYEIVGPQPASGSQTISTDTTLSASPYIFNCSIRSMYGLGGILADGSKPTGFKSMVIAQFTGVSLQRDLSCWQKYSGGSWGSFVDYADYINTQPDNVRMNPARLSFHIRAINNAIIQEVSVFAIGQGIHHWTQSGGELTITNSNSNFGGCAAISEGYRTTSFPADKNWSVGKIRVAANLSDLTNSIDLIYLGTVASYTSSTITLTTALADSEAVPGVPDLLARGGYTLRSGSRVWIENPAGTDWSSTFTSSAWSSGSPTVLNISAALSVTGDQDPVGKRVYIRRLVDTRTPEQRQFYLLLNNTDSAARTPVRDYVLQTVEGGTGIASSIPTTSAILVQTSKRTKPDGVARACEVVLRRGNASVTWTSGSLYRVGDTVKKDNKHYTCLVQNSDTNFDTEKWDESFVHTSSSFNPEDFWKNTTPILIFDNDTSSSQTSTTLGYNLTTVWNTDALIQAQYRSATDYRGCHLLLTALGFSSAQAHTILTPQPNASRNRNPSVSGEMGGFVPSGAANALGNWPLEFRRPSIIRLFGHAWEWAGTLNYTKALPPYQGELSAQNKFTYYFTSANGGRVYGTGFNEEGFQVSPRGLEDIATGETISVENLGSSDIDPPTQLNNLTLTGTTTIKDVLDIQATNITFPSNARGTTAQYGVAQLADAAALRSGVGISGNNDTDRNASIDTAPEVVTVKALEYWKVHNRLLSQRSGVQYIYVNPSSSNNLTTIDQLLAAPPITAATAVKTFTAAALYASSVFSSTETVEFRLGPGLYIESGTLTFNSITRIRAWDFNSNVYLNDSSDGGTVPFATANFYDPTKQPTFLTQPDASYPYTSGPANPVILSIRPLQLIFNQDSTITGVAWWGSLTTMGSASVPDSFFRAGGQDIAADQSNATNWRSYCLADSDNSLNYYLRDLAVAGSSTNPTIYGMRGFPCMSFAGSGTIANVSIGAMVPASRALIGGETNLRGLVGINTEKEIVVSGLRLVGNVKVSSEVNTGTSPNYAGIRFKASGETYNVTSYFLTGHSTVIFMPSSPLSKITLRFGTPKGVGNAGTYSIDYNYDWNNVHLLNSLNPPTAATAADNPGSSNWKNQGPAFDSVFDLFNGFIATQGRSFSQNWVKTSDGNTPVYGTNVTGSPGFVGKFGNYHTQTNISANLGTSGLSSAYPASPMQLAAIGIDTPSTIFRVAGTGVIPAENTSGLTAGQVSALSNFAALNVDVRTTLKGIDATTANTAYRTMVL